MHELSLELIICSNISLQLLIMMILSTNISSSSLFSQNLRMFDKVEGKLFTLNYKIEGINSQSTTDDYKGKEQA
ncbi:hypothetical protein HanIR_Chr04g0194301 [Helianthus annuus]|nr:hypothetical protein HanIR_Chr04g0194301 [Helianthus annuus]